MTTLRCSDPVSPHPRVARRAWRFLIIGVFGLCAPSARAGIVPDWTADGDQADARFGTIAPAGDVNGDGIDDVLIGAYAYDHPEVNEGMAFLYLGTPAGLAVSPAWACESDQAGAQLGDKLSGAGDVNGDGYDDLIVGAAFYADGQTGEGAAFLYLGSADGPADTTAWMAEGNLAGGNFGACVQGAGDVNGDGLADVIVGAWLYSNPEYEEGRAYVYLGSPAGLDTLPVWTGESNSSGAVYGYFCTGAGDLNGDGYDDIVVGARRFSGNGLTKEGRVYVYYGSPSGPSATADWIHDGGQVNGEFGASVAAAGDVDGDGFDDLLVGAFRYDIPNMHDAGAAYLFRGSANGLEPSPTWTILGDQAGGSFGYHVDGAGDVNHDGYADIVSSAFGYDVGDSVNAGRAYLYLGGPAGPDTLPVWIQDGDQAGGELGDAARGLGDVNGDGFADVGTGALYRDNGAWVNAGRANVLYGRANETTGPVPDHPSLLFATAAPNPFAAATTLSFALSGRGAARLTIHDLVGREVAELPVGSIDGGTRSVVWNAKDRHGTPVASGIYVARLETSGGVWTRKLVHLRGNAGARR